MNKPEQIKCEICNSLNIKSEKRFRRTSGPHVQGKLMSYGEDFNLHICLECNHFWEIKDGL